VVSAHNLDAEIIAGAVETTLVSWTWTLPAALDTVPVTLLGTVMQDG
jgi:hypothetical protein